MAVQNAENGVVFEWLEVTQGYDPDRISRRSLTGEN